MFAWKDKKGFQESIAKLVSAESNGKGANRRAINLVPLPVVQERHEISQSHRIRYHQLLVSIEARQSTCCLRVISEHEKSRSAILVFRGRVLGCIYGSKDQGHQIFGQEAHSLAMADLAKPDNIVDTYLLSEELVLAGGALFHGEPIDPPMPRMSSEEAFEAAATHLMHTNSPGCIVVNSQENEAVCMVYIFRGHIIGVYSFKDGWVGSLYESALHYVVGTPNTRIMASALAAHSIKEVEVMTFSLTGIGERAPIKPSNQMLSEYDEIAEISSKAQIDSGRHSPIRNNGGLIRTRPKTLRHDYE